MEVSRHRSYSQTTADGGFQQTPPSISELAEEFVVTAHVGPASCPEALSILTHSWYRYRILYLQYIAVKTDHAIIVLSGGHFTKYWGGGGGVKFGSRKWHLQHSENTFCKKLGFQNTVLMVHLFSYKSHAKHRKTTFQRKYLHDY